MTFYVGPIAKALDGVDLTWAVGSVVSLVLYLGLVRWSGGSRPNIENNSGSLQPSAAGQA